MCHRRGDWSRTSDSASEPDRELESEEERDEAAWTVRAAKRLVALVSADDEAATDRNGGPTDSGGDPTDSGREPTLDRDAETPSVDATTEESNVDPPRDEPSEQADETDHERDEEPIPADD